MERTLREPPSSLYHKALLSAVPIPDPFVEEKRERIILKGDVPSPLNPQQFKHFEQAQQAETKAVVEKAKQLATKPTNDLLNGIETIQIVR